MLRRRSITSLIGASFALIWPFLNWDPILSRLPEEMWPTSGILLQFVIASALAMIALGINKRPLKFFHFRGIGWRDLGAALLAFTAVFAMVALAQPVVDRFDGSAPSDAGSDPLREGPLWLVLVTATSAGVFEEFIYRGFIIEELGDLIRSREVAAVIAVVFFALAHNVNHGSSLELIYPGLAGAVITVLYLRRCNLPLCMLLHATLDSFHVLTR